jgi:hypothetical protein
MPQLTLRVEACEGGMQQRADGDQKRGPDGHECHAQPEQGRALHEEIR